MWDEGKFDGYLLGWRPNKKGEEHRNVKETKKRKKWVMVIFFLVVGSVVVRLLQGYYSASKIGGVTWCDLIHDECKTTRNQIT